MKKYPTIERLFHKVWLHTNLHPFGFFHGENGPCIDIRISDDSMYQTVPLKERVDFMIESDARMIEMGFTRQKMGEAETAEFIRTTQARGVLWYNLPASAKIVN